MVSKGEKVNISETPRRSELFGSVPKEPWISERASRGSWGCLGLAAKPYTITLWRQINYKNKGFGARAIFNEMKGLSGFRWFFYGFR